MQPRPAHAASLFLRKGEGRAEGMLLLCILAGAFLLRALPFAGLVPLVGAALGTLSVFLVATLVHHLTAHRVAALLAAALYAVSPEVVALERGLGATFNLLCLAAVLCLLLASEAGSTERPGWVLLAGLLLGAATPLDPMSVPWLVGALGALALLGQRRMFITFAVSAVLAAALSAVLFGLWTGEPQLAPRFPHLASRLLALGAVALVVKREAEPVILRMSLVAWGLGLAALFALPAAWAHPNAHLMAPEALLAGGALAAVLGQRVALKVAFVLVLAISMGLQLWDQL